MLIYSSSALRFAVVALLIGYSSVASGDIVVSLDFTDTANNGSVGSLGSGAVTLTTNTTDLTRVIGTAQGGPPTVRDLGTFSVTDSGFTAEYHVSVDVESTGMGDADVGRGGSGTLSPGGNLLSANEELTFSNPQLTFVSGDDVFEILGFSGVRIGNLSGVEEIQVNELLVADGNSGEGNGGSHTPTAPLDLASTIVATGVVGGVSVNVVDITLGVSQIPEPTSASLLAFSVVGCVLRRRRG